MIVANICSQQENTATVDGRASNDVLNFCLAVVDMVKPHQLQAQAHQLLLRRQKYDDSVPLLLRNRRHAKEIIWSLVHCLKTSLSFIFSSKLFAYKLQICIVPRFLSTIFVRFICLFNAYSFNRQQIFFELFPWMFLTLHFSRLQTILLNRESSLDVTCSEKRKKKIEIFFIELE